MRQGREVLVFADIEWRLLVRARETGLRLVPCRSHGLIQRLRLSEVALLLLLLQRRLHRLAHLIHLLLHVLPLHSTASSSAGAPAQIIAVLNRRSLSRYFLPMLIILLGQLELQLLILLLISIIICELTCHPTAVSLPLLNYLV